MIPLPLRETGTAAAALSPAERSLIRLALDLGAGTIGGPLSSSEAAIAAWAAGAPPSDEGERARVAAVIKAGQDPLGDRLCQLRPPAVRRSAGAFFTPATLVRPMLSWALDTQPSRMVDPGCGSGRFTLAAIRRRPALPVIAVDSDPVATLLTRAGLAVLGARHATVLNADYLTLRLPAISGRTAFVGNPPYVRHHELSPETKAWAATQGKLLGYSVSGLSGLHAYFFLATALYAATGDVGCFVTSAEWLDVGYGSLIRDLLLNGLGLRSLHLLGPNSVPFADAMATAAITCFEVGGRRPAITVQLAGKPEELADLTSGHAVPRERLEMAGRWTQVFSVDGRGTASQSVRPAGLIPLGRVARVHRGVVTGANDFFVLTREEAERLGVARWCRPVISSAKEILSSSGVLRDGPERQLLLDVPKYVDRKAYPDLDVYLARGERARRNGLPAVSEGYIASRRHPWWHLGRITVPPIVVSYMARQAPVFALNPDGLALINIAHGLFPVRELTAHQLAALVDWLNGARAAFRGCGRTYHGGLEKFEPGELEALLIPAGGPWCE